MHPWRVIFFLVAASCIILDVCASSPFSEKEEAQLSGLNHLIGLEDDAILTCNLGIFSALVNVSTAEKNCRNFTLGLGESGELVKIDDETRDNQVARLLELAYPIIEQPEDPERITPTRWAWIGLRIKHKHAVKERTYDPRHWEYSDETEPGDYQSWILTHKAKGFVKINHAGYWDNSYGVFTHPYVCQYNGKYIVSREMNTWDDAKEICEAAGMELAAIRSDDELAEIMRAADYYLDARTEHKWDDHNWLWIGGSDEEKEHEWRWTDGSLVEWDMKWEPHAGNDNAGHAGHLGVKVVEGQDFLALSRWGTVDDSYGHIKKRPFACECPGQ